MSDVSDQVLGVLAAHPLEDGEGFYAGLTVCAGCHQVFDDPGPHILAALAEVLDPSHTAREPETEPVREDPRESRIVWKAS